MISDNLIQFLAGSLIPLTLLPEGVLKGLSFLPFYYVSYLPSMLIMGRNHEETIFGLSILLAWNLFFIVINHRTFYKLRLKYEGVGI